MCLEAVLEVQMRIQPNNSWSLVRNYECAEIIKALNSCKFMNYFNN